MRRRPCRCRSDGRGVHGVRRAGAMPLRRRKARSERLPRGSHGPAVAAEVEPVSGAADHPRRSTRHSPAWSRFIPPASVPSPRAWRRARRGWPAHRAAGRPAARHLRGHRLRRPDAGRSTWSTTTPTSRRCRSGQRAIDHPRADDRSRNMPKACDSRRRDKRCATRAPRFAVSIDPGAMTARPTRLTNPTVAHGSSTGGRAST